MFAKFCFQCPLTGQRQSMTFKDSSNQTIEEQAKDYAKSLNHDIIDYRYFNK